MVIGYSHQSFANWNPTQINFFSYLYHRGHTVRAVTESFQMSKDAGFKVVAHMMPDLPNVGLERDIEQFIVREIIIYICSIYFICIFLYFTISPTKVTLRSNVVLSYRYKLLIVGIF